MSQSIDTQNSNYYKFLLREVFKNDDLQQYLFFFLPHFLVIKRMSTVYFFNYHSKKIDQLLLNKNKNPQEQSIYAEMEGFFKLINQISLETTLFLKIKINQNRN